MKKLFPPSVLVLVGVMCVLIVLAQDADAQEFLFKVPQQVIFRFPHGVTVAPDGSVWVADTESHRILKLDPNTLSIQLTIGSFGSALGQFNGPAGITVDAAGNVFVVDSRNHRIQRRAADGTFTQWGTQGSNPGQFIFEFFGSIGGDVAVDGSGNVYVADRFNHRIQKFTNNGVFITQWGSQGSGAGQFFRPTGLALDGSGNVYVATKDQHRIQKFTGDGVFLTMWGTQGSGPGQFNGPWGIGLDSSGNVYVADRGNHRIQKFTGDGAFLTMWGSYGCTDGKFNGPLDVALDLLGNAYVVDTGSDRIQKFTDTGAFIAKSGSYRLISPHGIAADGSGNFYVAVSGKSQILKFNSSGECIAMWGSGGSGPGQFSFSFDGSVGGSVAVGGSGNVYVADRFNHRIQKFTGDGVFLTMWGTQGSGPGQFFRPTDVAVDASGNVYVTAKDQPRIQKFTGDGAFITQWGSSGTGDGQLGGPWGLAVDGSGNVYVAERNNRRIQKFTNSGAFITKWGTQGSGDGQFEGPLDVAVDPSGNVYVVDTNNHRIQKFTSSGAFITKWGTQGSGDGQFQAPHQGAADGSGRVYIADTFNNRVQVFAFSLDGDSDGLNNDFEAGFGQEGIKIFNPETGNTASSTGSAAAGSVITSGSIKVFFPPGTAVGAGGSELEIKFVPGSEPKLEIENAALPAGQRKSVEMPIGSGEIVCVDDRPNATIESVGQGACPPPPSDPNVCPAGKIGIAIPAGVGQNTSAATKTPSPECTPTTYTVTRISADKVKVEGLVHTALGMRINQPPVAHAGADQTVSAGAGCVATVTLNGSNSSDPDGDPLTYTWSKGATVLGAGVTLSTALALGSHTITLTVDDGKGGADTDDVLITVVDTTPPTITVSSSPVELWPLNHRYVTVSVAQCVTAVTDACAGDIAVSNVDVVSVSSDEPEDAPGGGDGNTVNDIVIASDCKSVQLRAERQGAGNGRVYTLKVKVSDPSGNIGTAACKVAVPHSQGAGGQAVDDGASYTVFGSCGGSGASAKPVGIHKDEGVNLTSVDIPKAFRLGDNYPNPFNSSTMIQYDLPAAGFVTLKVFNVLGQQVAVLVQEYQKAGRHAVTFDAKGLSSGVYIYQIQMGKFIETKRMVLTK